MYMGSFLRASLSVPTSMTQGRTLAGWKPAAAQYRSSFPAGTYRPTQTAWSSSISSNIPTSSSVSSSLSLNVPGATAGHGSPDSHVQANLKASRNTGQRRLYVDLYSQQRDSVSRSTPPPPTFRPKYNSTAQVAWSCPFLLVYSQTQKLTYGDTKTVEA